MIIQRLDQITSEIERLRELRRQAKSAQQFHTRATQLQRPSDELDRLATQAQEFQRRGITIYVNHDKMASISKQAHTIADAFRDDPHSAIVLGSEHTFSFLNPLTSLPDEIQASLSATWLEYVRSKLPETQQSDLLQTLRRLPGFKEHVERITTLTHEAERLGKRLPGSAAEIERVAELGAELRAEWQALPTEGVPAEVRAFLTAAVDGAATFSQLTGSVVEWLRANNLSDSIRISLRA